MFLGRGRPGPSQGQSSLIQDGRHHSYDIKNPIENMAGRQDEETHHKDGDPGEANVVKRDGSVERVGGSRGTFRVVLKQKSQL